MWCVWSTIHRSTMGWILSLLIFVTIIQRSEPLKCYQCLIFECPTLSEQSATAAVCDSMIAFVQETLLKYYPYADKATICPPHTEMAQWSDLSLTYPSNQDCPIAYGKKHPFCALGRIRVVTTVTALDGQPINLNVTSHATVLGCATRALLTDIEQYKPEKKEVIDSNLLDTCPNWKYDSPPSHNTQPIQLRHEMELEQCNSLSDLCTIDYGATLKHPTDFDFCILPILSKVKSFDPLGGNYNSRSRVSFLGVALIVGVSIGLLIGAISFCGIYCDNQ